MMLRFPVFAMKENTMKQQLLSLGTARRVWCALALALAAGAAHAQWTLGLAQADMLVNSWYNNQMWKNVTKVDCWPPGHCRPIDSSQQGRASPSGGARSLLYSGEPFATTKGIEGLAVQYPAKDQRHAVEVFTKIIFTFDKTVPRTYGIPANNLATAYTAILAGGYAAYTNRPFPEEAVKPLFRQVEQAMANDPKILHASAEEKGALYQRWVGVGAFMLGWQSNLAQHPDPAQQAKMQKTGANILRSLGIDPGKARFTRRGMELS
jgi:hypothetical protein